MFYRIVGLGIVASLLGTIQSVKAQDKCTPLALLGGEGSEITKTVAQPTIPGPFGIKITRNNWNTDWAVPGGTKKYKYFVATVTSNDRGPFDIRFFLKYSDQTSDEIFNNSETIIESGKPLVIRGERRQDNVPFQINLFVNGVPALGKTYTASVVGCQ